MVIEDAVVVVVGDVVEFVVCVGEDPARFYDDGGVASTVGDLGSVVECPVDEGGLLFGEGVLAELEFLVHGLWVVGLLFVRFIVACFCARVKVSRGMVGFEKFRRLEKR